MERLDHPNIIRLYEVIDSLPKMHIILEYAPGGELFECISKDGPYSEDNARPIFAQVISAVQHMVSLHYVWAVIVIVVCSSIKYVNGVTHKVQLCQVDVRS